MYNVAQVIDEKCTAKKGCRLCIMYCPEANVLISRAVDPESKTPAFKNILITIEPEAQ